MRIARMLLPVLIASNCVVAFGQDDPNTKLMKQIYTKIAEAVGVGSNDAETGQTYLILVGSGILLDPKLQANTADGRKTLAETIDRVAGPNWIYSPRTSTTFQVYSRIMKDHEPAVVIPNAEETKIYKNYCKVIHTECDNVQNQGVPTAAYTNYKLSRSALSHLLTLAEQYRADHNTTAIPADMADDIQAATDQLEAISNRSQIEAAEAGIKSFERIDPNAWWGELAGRFGTAETISGIPFGQVNVFPSYATWLDPTRSWRTEHLTQNDLQVTTDNSSTSVGGGGGFNAGLWSVGADAQHEEDRKHYEMSGKNFDLKFDVTTVTLTRPWMDESVFESRAWKFREATPYDKKQIASGADAKAGKTPPDTDVMPFIPVGLLLARNVEITADWSTKLSDSFSSHTSGSTSVGWGPFKLSGHYDKRDSHSYDEGHAAGNTISWAAPQILGFFVQVLGKTPDRDPCLHFASDKTPVPASCSPSPSDMKLMTATVSKNGKAAKIPLDKMGKVAPITVITAGKTVELSSDDLIAHSKKVLKEDNR